MHEINEKWKDNEKHAKNKKKLKFGDEFRWEIEKLTKPVKMPKMSDEKWKNTAWID